MAELSLEAQDLGSRAVSPFVELGAYEVMWDSEKASFKTIADKFAKVPDALPSSFVDPKRATSYPVLSSGFRFGLAKKSKAGKS